MGFVNFLLTKKAVAWRMHFETSVGGTANPWTAGSTQLQLCRTQESAVLRPAGAGASYSHMQIFHWGTSVPPTPTLFKGQLHLQHYTACCQKTMCDLENSYLHTYKTWTLKCLTHLKIFEHFWWVLNPIIEKTNEWHQGSWFQEPNSPQN